MSASPKPTVRAELVCTVIAHYQMLHPRYKGPRGSKGWRAVEARLREGHTVDDLREAIDGCHRSPFHCGENEQGKTYQSLELICRDSDKVLNFIELSKKPAVLASARTMKTARALAQWAERKARSGDDATR